MTDFNLPSLSTLANSMSKTTTIEIAHEGEDYVGVVYNGEYIEVALDKGKAIKHVLSLLKLLLGK